MTRITNGSMTPLFWVMTNLFLSVRRRLQVLDLCFSHCFPLGRNRTWRSKSSLPGSRSLGFLRVRSLGRWAGRGRTPSRVASSQGAEFCWGGGGLWVSFLAVVVTIKLGNPPVVVGSMYHAIWRWSKPFWRPFWLGLVSSPPVLEPILVGIGMFRERACDSWPFWVRLLVGLSAGFVWSKNNTPGGTKKLMFCFIVRQPLLSGKPL